MSITVVSVEQVDELWAALEDACPFCGGVHVTIEQMDMMGVSELNTLRCACHGTFTVPKQMVEDEVHFQMLMHECPFILLSHFVDRAVKSADQLNPVFSYEHILHTKAIFALQHEAGTAIGKDACTCEEHD